MTEIFTENGSLTELPPDLQKRMILRITRHAEDHAKEGDTFYLVSLRWLRTWSAYVSQNPAQTVSEESSLEVSRSSTTFPRPQSIDNSNLICESSSNNSAIEIHNTLIEGIDYILLPENAWNHLYAWYGGGPALARKAIIRSSSTREPELTVEVYPLRLQLHLSPRAEQCAIRMSRRDKIRELHSKACEIFHLNSDQVNIWDYYGLRKYSLLNDFDKTLDEANIQTDQDILVEVIDHSGSGRYTTIVHANSFLGNNGFSRGSYSQPSQSQNLSLATENGPTSNGFSTRGSCLGLTGLHNLGNTCFMNSAIQCVVHTPELVSFFIGDYYQQINWQNPLGNKGKLAMAFGELLRGLWAPGQAAFSPREFKAKLSQFAPQFRGLDQHDAQEFLAFLLDGLHEDLNRVKQKPYVEAKDEQVADECWANHISRNDSIVVDLFQGQYKSTLSCPVCDKLSVAFDPFMYLSLPIPSVTTRTMTVTVFSCDGSAIPATCTVTVPTLGHCRDLIQELTNACSLMQNDTILLTKIQDHMIDSFFDDPLMSLSVIKNNVRLVAYKIPKLMKKIRYLQFVQRREEPDGNNTEGEKMWKPYGTPLIYPISSDAVITRGDIQLIICTILSAMLKTENSDTNKSSIVSNVNSLMKIPLKLVDKNNEIIDISVGEEVTVRLLSCSMSVIVYIDWSTELMNKYEMHHLENLPEVFKNVHVTKKVCVRPLLSLYMCIEAFLLEEPLVPEDMWLCPECKEQRRASKKFDIWRLPEVLLIHLKRFAYSRTMRSKLEMLVNFPLVDFDLTKYDFNKNNTDPHIYELYALINHYGNIQGGHYTAHVKLNNEKRWYRFDDDHVSPINEGDVVSNAAYVLFYRRVKNNVEPGSTGANSSAVQNVSAN